MFYIITSNINNMLTFYKLAKKEVSITFFQYKVFLEYCLVSQNKNDLVLYITKQGMKIQLQRHQELDLSFFI